MIDKRVDLIFKVSSDLKSPNNSRLSIPAPTQGSLCRLIAEICNNFHFHLKGGGQSRIFDNSLYPH